MATTNRNKLNKLYSQWAPGTPLTSEDLAALGISADLAVHYVRAGWLTRLMRGDLLPAQRYSRLVSQSRRLATAEAGGIARRGKIGARLVRRAPVRVAAAGVAPVWLGGCALARLVYQAVPRRIPPQAIFNERPDALLHVGPFEKRSGASQVAAPERALLELLSEVGVRQSLREARELTENAYNLRADVLHKLLQHCASVKSVRQCLQLGRELSLPWAAELDPATLPTGSRRPWVSKSADGLLILKP